MSADRDITPALVAQLETALLDLPRQRRPSLMTTQVVLHHLARWARRTDEPMRWTVNDSVEQIHIGTRIQPGQVRKVLDALGQLGALNTIRRGGGPGLARRGSTRLLVLDPRVLRAPERAQLPPVENRELRALEPGTARASAGTARAQARASASSPASSSAVPRTTRDQRSSERRPPQWEDDHQDAAEHVDGVVNLSACQLCRFREQLGYGPAGPRALRAARRDIALRYRDTIRDWLERGAGSHRIATAITDRMAGTNPNALPWSPGEVPPS